MTNSHVNLKELVKFLKVRINEDIDNLMLQEMVNPGIHERERNRVRLNLRLLKYLAPYATTSPAGARASTKHAKHDMAATVLCALGEAYSWHADYRDEWRSELKG